MARKNKKETLGNYVTKVKYFDIYQKFNRDRTGKVQSSDYRIVHAKNVIKDGIPNKTKATEFAVSMSNSGIKYEKHNKS